MKKFDPLQELDTSPDSEFIKAVDFVVQDIIPDRYILESVPLGVTPLVFQLCEIELVKMRTTYGAIEKVISEFINRPNDKGRYQRIHNIDPEDLKKLPVLLCDPIAIIQSQTVAKNPYNEDNKYNKPNGLVILVELTETKKSQHKDWLAPTIVAVHYNYQKQNLNITSVYGKPMGFWIENLSSNLLMYLNRPKCRQFMKTFLTPQERRRYNSKEDNERIKIINEMCDTEIHKDRSLNTRETSMEARSYIKESGHLLSSDNTPKPTLMQAIKEKISPKQPKRSIPTPTDYKTEEDFQRFKAKITLTRPLTQDEAFEQTMKVYAEFVPMDSPAYKDIEKNITPQIAEQYKQGKFITQQDVQQMRDRLANVAIPQARQEFHQAVHQEPSKSQEIQKNIQQDKGDKER